MLWQVWLQHLWAKALVLSLLQVPFAISSVSECDADVVQMMGVVHQSINKAPACLSKQMERRPPSRHHLYIATTPCQDFSTAGLNRGCAGQRGKLWYTAIEKVLDERPRARRPQSVQLSVVLLFCAFSTKDSRGFQDTGNGCKLGTPF